MKSMSEMVEVLGLDAGDIVELMEEFIRHSRKDVAGIETAIENDDPETLAWRAHSMKGAALNLYLDEISSIAADIEMKGKSGSIYEVEPLLKRLIDEGRRVAEAQAVDLVFHDLYQILFEACKRSDQNLSSMLQDILEGKHTEIDAQCGAIVKIGEQTGVPTPTHQTMLELVQLVSKKQHQSMA